MAETARRFDVFRFWDALDSRLNGAVTVGARERFAAIEDWHVIGEPGEPQFRIYPASGFPHYSGEPRPTGGIRYEHGDSPVSFFRDTSGMVHLRGELVRPEWGTHTEYAANYPAFALPVGYRAPGGTWSAYPVAGSKPSKATEDPWVEGEPRRELDPPLVRISHASRAPVANRGLVEIESGLDRGRGQVYATASVFLDGIRFLAAPVNRERYITDDDRPPFGF